MTKSAEGQLLVAGVSRSDEVDVTGHHGSTDPLTYDYWVVKLEVLSGANSITTTVPSNNLCIGQPVNVSYIASGSFSPGNTFTAQLSDASGSLSTPVSIGSVTSISSGSVSCLIPAITPSGNGYRIRVVSFQSCDHRKRQWIRYFDQLPCSHQFDCFEYCCYICETFMVTNKLFAGIPGALP
jgi:hypothetical protein